MYDNRADQNAHQLDSDPTLSKSQTPMENTKKPRLTWVRIKNIPKNNKKLLLVASSIVILLGSAVVVWIYCEKNNVNDKYSSRSPLVIQEQEKALVSDLTLTQGDVTTYTNKSHSGSLAVSPGYIWVANGHGLLRYDKSTNQSHVFTEIDGLQNTRTIDVIYHDDAIWVVSPEPNSTRSATISKLNVKTDEWLTFSSDNYNLGRLINAQFAVEDGNLTVYSYAENSTENKAQTAIYNKDNQTWTKQQGTVDWPKKEYTRKAWNNQKNEFSLAVQDRITTIEKQNCGDELYAGVRPGQIPYTPFYDGYVVDENSIWYGCTQGFIVIDQTSGRVDFKSPISNYPAIAYDYLAAKNGEFFVQTNLGLGIINPSKLQWTKVRDNRTSYNGAIFSWWNSAVWIDDRIYFIEYAWEDPSITEDNLSLWLYNISDQTLKDVTPQPQEILQESIGIVPYLLRKTDDGKSLIFQDGLYVLKFTPGVKEPFLYNLDPKAKLGSKDTDQFWGYDEAQGGVWYLTDQYLGRVTPENKLTKINLPTDYDSALEYGINANSRYVVASYGQQSKIQVLVYDIHDKKWSNDIIGGALVGHIEYLDYQVLVEDGRLRDLLFTSVMLEGLTESITDTDNGQVIGRFQPSALVAISVADGRILRFNNFLKLTESEISHIFYDGESVCVRHGLTGISCIKN